MKKILTTLLFALNLYGLIELYAQQKSVYSFDIKEEIAPPVWRKTQMAIDEAHKLQADVILINMNTYGGQVDIADSIRSKILSSTIPVYVFIENNAASAGALISIACDSIYMRPGSTIGAATVVNQNGEQVPDKYQSYMRKKMRATAEQTGRNPDIAEAMVDPDKVVQGISDSGKVVTFTVKEAIEHGFCEAEINTLYELFERTGLTGSTIIKQRLSTIDKIIGWLINPMISGVLIMIILGGIYFELQSPGIGFPILAAAIAAILYFAPLYLEGLAENWEIILFLAGIVLIILEIFVIPGFGIAGISGILLIISGLVLTLVNNIGFDFNPVNSTGLLKAIVTVLGAIMTAIILAVFFGVNFLKSQLFQRFVLSEEQTNSKGYVSLQYSEELLGQTGISLTVMRPGGKIEIEAKTYEATCENGYLEKGETVIVTDFQNGHPVVKKKS